MEDDVIFYHYVDTDGTYLGAYDTTDHPDIEDDWILVPAPENGAARWVNGAWDNSEPQRQKRDRLLLELDGKLSNPLRWADLNTQQQTAWATYRQALLDVPEQTGFPDNIVWPTQPE